MRSGHPDIGIGGEVGSCIWNLTLTLGLPALLLPLLVSTSMRGLLIPIVMDTSFLFALFLRCGRIRRWQGLALLALYGLFLWASLAS